jgi:GAF domain-containing protein
MDTVLDPEPVVDEALRLIVALARAELGYLELLDKPPHEPLWRVYAANASAFSSARERISQGIVRSAIVEGRQLETTSAIGDARFADLASVKHNQIGAVLCTPIGHHVARGVLYLQSARGAFSPSARARAIAMAQRIVPIAHRLVGRRAGQRPRLADDVRELQERRVGEALRRHDGNIAMAARELGVGRKFMYRVMGRSSGVYPEDTES